ncbi:hypothetical protein GCM10023172_10570 [Hymenobacter ginsengisoli]|uniref:Uncharacterized protein n=1 Tax=Hymenobacter ginsengisoli TaxID=1051626 RepID=A0ABP8Q5T1_9BACT
MLLHGVVGVGAAHRPALPGEGGSKLGFHCLLGGPALLIGGQAQIAAGKEKNFVGMHGNHGLLLTAK